MRDEDLCPRVCERMRLTRSLWIVIATGARSDVRVLGWQTSSGSIRQQGGFATRGDLVAASSRSEFDAAVRAGDIVWFSRGRYGVPELDVDLMTAHGLRGVLSHASAAMWHGWEVKTVPDKTHITIPRRRRLAPSADRDPPSC